MIAPIIARRTLVLALVLALAISGCIDIKTRPQPEDTSVKEVLIGEQPL
jgi:hypothetical protein